VPRKKKTDSASTSNAGDVITSIKYPAKRKNIPPAGLEAQGVLREAPLIRHQYNPHLPTVLRSATDAMGADKLPEVLATARQRALSAEETKLLADALRRHEPWLEWSGKREKPWFEVDPVALHMHERISTQAILRVLAREDVDRDLFADPQHDYAKAVQFYQHDVDWANRMILGDSLQVMASLARREDLAGKVQMIYLDPPYGIKFSSNFQPKLGQRDVKDREQDLTREPEMIKAYRDTWTLGVHSYLAYLRDRLTMAKALLSETGSIFVQISDENIHRVRCVMDEVFGTGNFIAQIAFVTTGGQSSDRLAGVFDFLLWYGKDSNKIKYRQVFTERALREGGGWAHSRVEFPSGLRANVGVSEVKKLLSTNDQARAYTQDKLDSSGATPLGSAPFTFEGRVFTTPANTHWKTSQEGLTRLAMANRLEASTNSLRLVKFFDDFSVQPINNVWDDTSRAGYIDEKIYVVQTSTKVVERCLLMTTDPGDLVLDPTCGSGTTAYVAEQWGRRWITCDSSRVALALAKHRLMTSKFDFNQLRELSAEDVDRNPNGTWIAELDPNHKPTGRKMTFQCKTVPHVTLKSIARNTSLDPIFAKHAPILAGKLKELNREVTKVSAGLKEKLTQKLIQKHREEGVGAITDADIRRWLLPDVQSPLIKPIPARKPLKGVTPKQA
jgi:adenine-specific DNA-methyltransferase